MESQTPTFLERSIELTGYRVSILHKPAFQIVGYTLIVPPHQDKAMIPPFIGQVMADGRFDSLKQAAAPSAPILGLGSWDEDCQPHGMRYTMCIEETPSTQTSHLFAQYPLHRQTFEACEWMCFDIPQGPDGLDQFWEANPYQLMRLLGYRFHLIVGVHFDVHPPDYDAQANPGMEFWITVKKEDEVCDDCAVREACGQIQPFTRIEHNQVRCCP